MLGITYYSSILVLRTNITVPWANSFLMKVSKELIKSDLTSNFENSAERYILEEDLEYSQPQSSYSQSLPLSSRKYWSKESQTMVSKQSWWLLLKTHCSLRVALKNESVLKKIHNALKFKQS